MSKPRGARRTFMNEKKFQYSLIAYFAVMTAAVIGCMYVGIYAFFARSIDNQQHMIDPNSSILPFLEEIKRSVFVLFAINSTVIFAGMLFFAFFLSHRIAGPLFQLRAQLEKMAEGEPVGEISFRKNDYFQDLATVVNRVQKRIAK